MFATFLASFSATSTCVPFPRLLLPPNSPKSSVFPPFQKYPAVSSLLDRLLSPSQQASLSNAALELIRSDLRDFHAVPFPVSLYHSVTAVLRAFSRSPCSGPTSPTPPRPASCARARAPRPRPRSRVASAADWPRRPSRRRAESPSPPRCPRSPCDR